MNVRYRVTLSLEEREALRELIARGRPQVRRVKRAQILLGADAGQSDEAIAQSVGVGTATVFRTKRRFVELGLEQALAEAPRPGAPRKLTEREELLLVATACSDRDFGHPPLTGSDHLTCRC
jgi:hypothetical protein